MPPPPHLCLQESYVFYFIMLIAILLLHIFNLEQITISANAECSLSQGFALMEYPMLAQLSSQTDCISVSGL